MDALEQRLCRSSIASAARPRHAHPKPKTSATRSPLHWTSSGRKPPRRRPRPRRASRRSKRIGRRRTRIAAARRRPRKSPTRAPTPPDREREALTATLEAERQEVATVRAALEAKAAAAIAERDQIAALWNPRRACWKACGRPSKGGSRRSTRATNDRCRPARKRKRVPRRRFVSATRSPPIWKAPGERRNRDSEVAKQPERGDRTGFACSSSSCSERDRGPRRQGRRGHTTPRHDAAAAVGARRAEGASLRASCLRRNIRIDRESGQLVDLSVTGAQVISQVVARSRAARQA